MSLSTKFATQLQGSWLWRRDVLWLLFGWELIMMILVACFPVALLELSFGMLGLPILLFALAPNDGKKVEAENLKCECNASSPSADHFEEDGTGGHGSRGALPQIMEIGAQMRSLFTVIGLVFAVNLLPLVVHVSPGLVEGVTVVLFVVLGHLLLSKTALVHAQRQSQKLDIAKTVGSNEDCSIPSTMDAEIPDESMELAAPQKRWGDLSDSELGDPGYLKSDDEEEESPQDDGKSEVNDDSDIHEKQSTKLVWADVEEDEFQQTLAMNNADYKSYAEPTEASRHTPRAEGGRTEGSHRSGGKNSGGKGKKQRKDGGGGGKGNGGNKSKDEAVGNHHSAASPFTTKIRACGRAGDLAGALEAVEEALSSGLPNNSEVQNALLYALVHCGESAGSSAADLFEQMKETKQADVVSFNIMLRTFLDAGQHDKAKELLQAMAEHGLSANKVTLNELLGDRVKAQDRVGMWRVVDEMRATGFGITNVACSLLLKALSEATPKSEVRKTLALLDELSEPMDEALCSSAIEGCLRVKELELASNFMANLGTIKAKNRSVGLSPATYGSMIKAHGQAGNLEQTWATWNTMFENGASPSAVTFGCMVEALVMNSAVDEAWKLVHEMLSNEEHSGCVNTVIYSTVMKGFSHARRPDMCFSVLDEMHSRGVEANTITYNTLLDACAKCNSMTRVPEVFEEMKQSQIEPDKITYSTLIKGYCMVGELDCAFDLFEEMQADGKVGLDEIVYNALIDGCGRQQKVSRALQVLADMKRAKISPSNYTLSILVKLLGRARKLNDAIALVDDFRANYRVRPNVQVYTCLMQACLLNKRVGQALTVYNKMIAELQCLPDQKAFSVLLNGCIQAGSLKEAVQVARCAYNLPAQGLDKPEGREERAVGVENKTLATLDSKVRQQKLASDVIQDWEEVMETIGWRSGGRSHHGSHADDRSHHAKGDDRGRKGSNRPKGKGKGKDHGKDSHAYQ
jgi:pentatricopeptide repeat protein